MNQTVYPFGAGAPLDDPRAKDKTIVGGKGEDKMYGGADNDVMTDESGNDLMDGGAGNDVLRSGEGNDSAYGGAGNDQIHGGAGNDVMLGGAGNDQMLGGEGNGFNMGQHRLAYGRLRHGGAEPDQDPSASPLQASDFGNLPATVVIVAECDPLADDGADYVGRILAAGGRALSITEPGLVHGYLRARHSVPRAADSFARICRYLKEMGG